MRRFSKLLLGSVLALLFTALGILLLFPKYLFLESLLQKNRIFLLSQGVKEDINKVTFGKGRVFVGNEEIASFDRLELALVPFGVKAEILCKGKTSEIQYGLSGEIEISLRDFSCTKSVKLLRANLRISDGIYGTLHAEGVSNKNLQLDKISLNFRGESFTGSVSYLGMELKGSGKLKLNRKNPLKSKVSALFRGNGISVEVVGSLENLSVRPR
ncbi:hypothetical protein [Aquifex sp.]